MKDDIILGGEKRTKFSWKIFGIVMTVLAVAGIVFGVVSLVTKKNEVADAKAACTAGNNGSTACADTDGVSATNPVLAAEAPEAYTMSVTSGSFNLGDNLAYATLKVRNGDIIECKMEVKSGSGYDERDCQVSGVTGKIYKVVQLNNSSIEGFRDGFGLITTDGRVEYLPLAGNDGNNFEVMGTFKIDGFVIDAVNAEVKPNEYIAGSNWSVLFVLKSGKVLKLDAAMLEDL